MTQQLAYRQAAQDALATGRTYVEGYVMLNDGGHAEHAWTVDSHGIVFDSVFGTKAAVGGYYGVEIPTEVLTKALLETRGYGVLRSRTARKLLAKDAGWNEADHPRGQPGNAGQFGSGGAGGGSGKEPAAKSDSKVRSYGTDKPATNMEFVSKGGSGEHLEQLKELSRLIPLYHRTSLKGTKIVSAGTFNDIASSAQKKEVAELQKKHGAVTPSGMTNGDGTVIGMIENLAVPGEKLFGVIGTTKKIKLKDQEATFLHEIGHALDKKSNLRYTKTYAMGGAKNDAMLQMTNEEASNAAYYLNDPEEMFAELYAAAFAPNTDMFFGGMTRDRVEKVFAKSLAGLRNSSLG